CTLQEIPGFGGTTLFLEQATHRRLRSREFCVELNRLSEMGFRFRKAVQTQKNIAQIRFRFGFGHHASAQIRIAVQASRGLELESIPRHALLDVRLETLLKICEVGVEGVLESL